MPVSLHPGCLDRLEEVILSGLKDITVRDGQFINISSTNKLLQCSDVIPDSDSQKLERYISERPVYNFIKDRVS